MKAWTGALIAVLTIGLMVFGLGMRSPSSGVAGQAESLARMPQANGLAQPGAVAAVAATGLQAAEATQAPMLVNCGPGQQALVRQVTLANGQPASQVDCVGVAGSAAAYAAAQPAYAAPQVRMAADDDIVTAPRVVRTAETYRASAPTRQVEKPRRSWKKTALIIGGSTAAGAGVGGIVAGKKGALIGAAIGGGASTIYEAVKR
ncbi:MAG TPA: hypothetical protein PKK95_08980 [Vicinamibacterales bacterium]|nr:hypothetical protein [Acidobacteriota bacterium]HOC18388.1 hypothetical protein [Vicinamibacterales bacterium]